MSKFTLDWKQYAALARQAAAEGCVLLENKNNTLPLAEGETCAVFGRTQFEYYKSGTAFVPVPLGKIGCLLAKNDHCFFFLFGKLPSSHSSNSARVILPSEHSSRFVIA